MLKINKQGCCPNLADHPKLPDLTQYEDSGQELHVSNFV